MAAEQAKGWGYRLRRARKRAGITQEKLATMIGVRRSAVSAWEKGGQTPHPLHRQEAESLLGMEGEGTPTEAVSEAGDLYTSRPIARVPLYLMGHIAGTTDAQPERIEDLEVTARQASLADAAFVIHGASMEPGFRNGDVVGVKLTSEARIGQLVIARVEGELTFKRFDGMMSDRIVLSALNPGYPPVIGREVVILGVYRWAIRESLSGEA